MTKKPAPVIPSAGFFLRQAMPALFSRFYIIIFPKNVNRPTQPC